jgi:ElaB/YqjD/DUF883 family membrane-anchored ribosome-binding protein
MSNNIREKVEGTIEGAAAQARDAREQVKQFSGETSEHARTLVEEAAHRAGEVAQETAHAAREKTDEAIAAVGKGMSSLGGAVREHSPHEGMASSAAGTIAEQMEAGGKYLQEHGVGDMAGDLTRLIRNHPVPSLLVAFGAGFLAGSILRR